MTQPLVSVVMSVFNDRRDVGRAVDSILGQTWRDFEFIVIDDGSNDGTDEVLAEYRDPRLRVVRQQNTGLTIALNRGLALARGQYVARMDGDDVSMPTRLEKQVAYLEANPACVLVGCWAQVFSSPAALLHRFAPPNDDLALRWGLLIDSLFCHSAAMMRRDALLAVHGYDETFRYAQDYDLFERLAQVGKLGVVPEVLVDYYLDEKDGISMCKRGPQQECSNRVRARVLAGWTEISLARAAVDCRTLHALFLESDKLSDARFLGAAELLQMAGEGFCRQFPGQDSQAIVARSKRWLARHLLRPTEGGRRRQWSRWRSAYQLSPASVFSLRGCCTLASAGLGATFARWLAHWSGRRQSRFSAPSSPRGNCK